MVRAVSVLLACAMLVAAAPPASAQGVPQAPLDAASPAISVTPSGEPSDAPSNLPSPSVTVAPTGTPAPAPLALAKVRLQLNPSGTSTIAISGGVAPYAVAFGTPMPAASVPFATGAPAANPAATGSTVPSAVPAANDTPDDVAAAPGPSASSELATLTIDPVGPALVVNAAPAVRGRRPPAGTTDITVSDSAGSSVTASLLVGPNAGYFPQHLPVALVGDPSQEYTNVQIAAAIRRSAGLLPDARLVLGPPQGVPSALPAGQTLAIPVKVHVDGVGKYVDVDGVSTVDVTTTVAQRVRPATLFYSDDPENVKSDGILFRGTVTSGAPARLYYYHQALTPGHQIAIVLDTPQGAASVTVIGHGAGPNPAVFFVGQNATYRYLDDYVRGAGVALDIPVGAPVIIGAGDGPLNARDLVAGIFDIAVTSGDPVRLTVLSYTPGVDPRTLLDGQELATDGYHRRGEYDLSLTTPIVLTESLPENFRLPGESAPSPLPSAATDEPVAAGGSGTPAAASPAAAPSIVPGYTPPPIPEPTVIISQSGTGLPNLRPGGRALAGDYGLIHDVTLTLGNDTDVPRTLYFYEQPITGYPVTTTIDFAGDPAPIKLQCVKTRTNRYAIRAFTIQPHQAVTASGSYMTDGGSTYPIVLGLTATPPNPLPITMTEADGCFPKPAPTSPAPAPAAGT